jgi:hypothetical protein
MTPTDTLRKLVADMADAPFTGHTASGDPMIKAVKIINGHRVTVRLIGFEATPVVELDHSIAALTVEQAIERIR